MMISSSSDLFKPEINIEYIYAYHTKLTHPLISWEFLFFRNL